MKAKMKASGKKLDAAYEKSIDDLAKFTGQRPETLVKTLFFSANEGFDPKDKSLKAFAVLLRGNDEVNPIKLKNTLGLVNPPLMLTDEEVQQVTGAKPGSCGPVGLQIPIYADQGVLNLKNFIVGANEDPLGAGAVLQAAGDIRVDGQLQDGELWFVDHPRAHG